MPAARKKKTSDEEPAFEDLLGKLEGLVKKLEDGELPLEASLVAYEEGVGLVRTAQKSLTKMEGRLEKLTADGQTEALAANEAEAPKGASDDDELPF
jgi:exodeoxyribonuclease VII small subunit